MAQTRYLRAVEMLVEVKKLSKVTPVQVNMAQKRVNVAHSVRGRSEYPSNT